MAYGSLDAALRQYELCGGYRPNGSATCLATSTRSGVVAGALVGADAPTGTPVAGDDGRRVDLSSASPREDGL